MNTSGDKAIPDHEGAKQYGGFPLWARLTRSTRTATYPKETFGAERSVRETPFCPQGAE